MIRWKLAIVALIALALALLARERAPHWMATPPAPGRVPYNVIFLSVDTLRADRVGCYGYEARATTPTIDGLADESVLFENAITPAPWTTPAHMSMMTSLSPSSHGVMAPFTSFWRALQSGLRGYDHLPASRVTFAEVMAEHGYVAAAFTGGGTVDPAIGFDQGFGSYDTSMFKLTNENVGDMLRWVAAHAHSPFFLFWHTFEVHAPYLDADFLAEVVAPEHATAIAKRTQRIKNLLSDTVWASRSDRLRAEQKAVLLEHDAFQRNVCEALYTGGVRTADRWLGQVVDALRREGLYDKTILIVTSDHGEEFGEHRQRHWYDSHGRNLYEETVHVPLLIKLPNGYAGGTRVRSVVSTLDIMPTILDLLRIAPAKNEMQGRSLEPLWRGSSRGEAIAFCEAAATPAERKCVRTDRYKYIVTIDEQTVEKLGRKAFPTSQFLEELYDLRQDPLEHHDLLDSQPTAAARKVAADLQQRLRHHLAEQSGTAEAAPLSSTTIDRLRGLGYIEAAATPDSEQ